MRLVSFAVLSLLAAPCALAQERYGAPEGALFTYVPVPAFDHAGVPIKDADTGKRVEDGFCLYWKPGASTRRDRVPIIAGRVWWSAVSYLIDPTAREITVYRLWGPNVEALP